MPCVSFTRIPPHLRRGCGRTQRWAPAPMHQTPHPCTARTAAAARVLHAPQMPCALEVSVCGRVPDTGLRVRRRRLSSHVRRQSLRCAAAAGESLPEPRGAASATAPTRTCAARAQTATTRRLTDLAPRVPSLRARGTATAGCSCSWEACLQQRQVWPCVLLVSRRGGIRCERTTTQCQPACHAALVKAAGGTLAGSAMNLAGLAQV